VKKQNKIRRGRGVMRREEKKLDKTRREETQWGEMWRRGYAKLEEMK